MDYNVAHVRKRLICLPVEVRIEHDGASSDSTKIATSLYLFYNRELGSVATDFYANLWETLRVEIKEVWTISDLT